MILDTISFEEYLLFWFQVGGKNMQDEMVDIVKDFIAELLESCKDLGYEKHCVYLDQNFKSSEKWVLLVFPIRLVMLKDSCRKYLSGLENKH